MKTLESGVGARIKGVEDIKLLEELHEHVETLKVQVSELCNKKNKLAKEVK
jgi:chaperonin cofactor prefoldin